MADSYKHVNEPYVFVKGRDVSSLTGRLLLLKEDSVALG